ncbi:MAG: diguanylate cyclase [Spirochaetales bacterium]|nr:diguanylate cyclase [Spirochaetales bacterium]
MDPRTVLFVNFIYSFIVSLFMASAFFIDEYKFKGLVNWFIAFFLITSNFLILSLRGIIPVRIVIVLPHLLVVWAYIEIKRGLTLFFSVKNRIWSDFLIMTLFFLSLIFNVSNARLRIVSLSIASMLVFLDTIVLFMTKKNRMKTLNGQIPLLYSLALLVMTARLILGLQWSPEDNPLNTGNSLSTISLLFFLVNMVIFFALFFTVLNKILLERNKLIRRIQSISLTDELTGLMNRRGFRNVTKYELNRYTRTRHGFTFVICDIDSFKSVNDSYGHECGDIVLKSLGAILQRNMREIDTAARWGGEEFVLLLPETNREEAQTALERIRHEVEQNLFEYGGNRFYKTMSFGACYCTGSEVVMEDVINRADKNLYEAKENGKNRAIITSLSPPSPGTA